MQSGPANLPSASRSQYSLSRKSPLDCVHCYAAPYADSSYACLRALYLRFSCRGCAVDCLMRFYFPLGFQIQIPAVCVRVRACACLRCYASIRLSAWLSMEIFARTFLREKMRMGVRMDWSVLFLLFLFFRSFTLRVIDSENLLKKEQLVVCCVSFPEFYFCGPQQWKQCCR